MGERSWCQSRCILIKGILCLGGVDIGAERHAVGSLFTASLSPNKGGQRRRRKGGGGSSTEVPPVFRHLLLASGWHRGHCMAVSVRECVCMWMSERLGAWEEKCQPDPCFFFFFLLPVRRIKTFSSWIVAFPTEEKEGGHTDTDQQEGFVGISHHSCEYSQWHLTSLCFCSACYTRRLTACTLDLYVFLPLAVPFGVT